jgi:hypothetical protein
LSKSTQDQGTEALEKSPPIDSGCANGEGRGQQRNARSERRGLRRTRLGFRSDLERIDDVRGCREIQSMRSHEAVDERAGALIRPGPACDRLAQLRDVILKAPADMDEPGLLIGDVREVQRAGLRACEVRR